MVISISNTNEEALILCLEDGCAYCPNRFLCLTHSSSKKSSIFVPDVELYNDELLSIINKALSNYTGTVFDDSSIRLLNTKLKEDFCGTAFVIRYANNTVTVNCSISYLSEILNTMRMNREEGIKEYVDNNIDFYYTSEYSFKEAIEDEKDNLYSIARWF
jgi:hypothetical protein